MDKKVDYSTFANRVALVLLLLCSAFALNAQTRYVPTAENLEKRKWFEESRLGIFIHWGVYSLLGNGEWVMYRQNIGLDEYSLLPRFFNPIDFDAKEWAALIKSSGAKYVTFTTRHHDSFSMWDSKVSDYNIVQATPFKRDVVKELVEACREEGIGVMFYYSLLDWKRDEYLPYGKTGRGIPGRDSTKGNWDSYIQFMKDQLTELLTNYGQIDGIWFDGDWDKKDADWRYDEIYGLIHELQPQCLIGNNHHSSPKNGEDFQMFERDLPGQNTTGFGTDEEAIGDLPKEVCGTIAGSWGFDIKDRERKSFKEVLSYLVKAAGYGSNLLLNVSPMPNGEIQDYQKERLEELGLWLGQYGETIYGTEGGVIKPTDEYALTKKGNTIYIHILDPSKQNIVIPAFDFDVKSMQTYSEKKEIRYQQEEKGVLVVQLPEELIREEHVVVELSI